MPSLLLERMHEELARSFYRDTNNANDYYYVFLGRTYPWNDEGSPDPVVDNPVHEAQTRQDIIFVKKVSPTDIVFLIRNIPWVSGTVYDRYDDNLSSDNPAPSGATSLRDANFYVLTDDFNVYKCIDNNNVSVSTIKPTGTGTEIFETDDGYVWKFMYQIPVLDQTKFLSPEWIPARHYTGGYAFDVNGFLDTVDVISGGTGYVQDTTHVIIDGDGKGAVAVPTVVGGSVTAVDVFVDGSSTVYSGSGYSFIFASIIGDGSGAELQANMSFTSSMPVNEAVPAAAIPGAIHVIAVTASGQNYVTETTSVAITGNGENAEARAVVVNGKVTAIEVTNPGTNYTWATVQINSPVGTGATARAIISPKGGHGFDSVDELYASAFSLMVNMGVTGDDPDIFVNNDYRQMGLIKNLKLYDSFTAFQSLTGSACYVATVPDATKYHADDVITSDDGGSFRVIQVIGSDVWLQPINDKITSSSTLTNATTAIGSLTINSLTNPEFDVYSGQLLYVNNKSKVDRVPSQVETLQIFFSF